MGPGSAEHRTWWVVLAMAVVVLPLPIDSFGLVVALPSIGARFSASTATLAWVLNVAMLTFGAGVMVLGRLSDVFGRRRIVICAMATLGIGSIGCALAPSIGVLIAFRAVEGLGMSGVYAASFPIVNNAFPPDRRALGLGLWAGGFMLGTVIGPPLAGWFCQHLTWRWIFWVNVPLLAVGLVLTLYAVRESRDDEASRTIDWFGIIVPTLGVFCLLFALQSASGDGWHSPMVLATLVAGPVLLGLFVLLEPRRREPLIDFGLFASRTYWSACGVALSGNVTFAAVLFLTPLYLQVALGYSPLGAGTVLLAISVPCFVFSVAAGPLCSRFGTRRVMIAGMLLLTGGCAGFAAVSPQSGLTLVLPVLAITGTGLAGAFNGSNIAGVAAVPESKAGAGSGVLSQVRLVGQALGVAVALVVFDVASERRLDGLLPGSGLTPVQRSDVHGVLAGSPAARQALAHDAPSVADTLDAVVRDVFAGGLRWAMVVIAGIALLGTVSACIAGTRGGIPAGSEAGESAEVDTA